MAYHPRANGKFEGTNKIIEAIITNILQLHLNNWVDKLPIALQAYWKTWRNTTSFTPCVLAYERELFG